MKSNRCHVRTSLRGSRTPFHDAHSGRRGDWLIQTLGLFLAFSQGRCGVWILWPLHREFCFPHPCSTLYPSSQEPNGLDGSVCRSDGRESTRPASGVGDATQAKQRCQRRGRQRRDIGGAYRMLASALQLRSNRAAARLRRC